MVRHGISADAIARVAHEVNRVYCQSMGDFSQPSWAEAPDWQKTSCVDGVKFVASNPELSAFDAHADWLKHKREEGWVYGEVKDVDKKTHPCMVDFEDLPKEHQVKVFLFRAVVRSMLVGD